MLQFYIILLLHAVRPCFSPLQTLREELVTQGGKQSSAACSLTDSERTAPPLVASQSPNFSSPFAEQPGFSPILQAVLDLLFSLTRELRYQPIWRDYKPAKPTAFK